MAAIAANLDDILGEAAGMARQHAAMLAGLIGAITAGYSALDLAGVESGAFVINLVVSVLVQYLVLEKLLADRMTSEALSRGRSYMSLFGSAFLSGLAIVVGLIMLVLPGVYLAGRWLSSGPQVVAGGKSATEALRSSWDASEDSQVPHCLAIVILSLPYLLIVGAAVALASTDPELNSLPTVLLLNFATAAATTGSWLMAAAAYRATTPVENRLNEVFA